MRSMRTRCACLSTFCFSHTCTLFPVLVFIFHFYFYHQDIVNCSKVKQCMYFPFSKLAVGTRQQHIFSFDRLLFKSLNTCISQLTCPHFRLAPLLTIRSISIIRFHFLALFVKATANNRHHRQLLLIYH